MAKKPAPDEQAEKRRLEGFEAKVASDKGNGYGMEDADGEYRAWNDLSAEGKLWQLAGNAAYSDVSFEAFAREARDVLGHLPPAAREEAALWLALRNEKELHQLAKLLPEHDRLEPYPLVEQLRDTLDYYRGRVAELSGDARIGQSFKASVAEAARQEQRLAAQLFSPPPQGTGAGHDDGPQPEPPSRQPRHEL
jgi:hypothetical protein